MIADSLEGVVLYTMIDALADDNFDTAKVIGRAPMGLTQKLLLEYGESDSVICVCTRHDIRPGDI